MKMIIGGAFQGKKAYAEKTYKIKEEQWIDGVDCDEKAIYEAKGICHFHQLIRRMQSNSKTTNLVTWAETLYQKNPDLIIVTDEVGYGIVPIDAEERAWREACGRVCTVLASHAEEVVRVCCGIGTKIKEQNENDRQEENCESISDTTRRNTGK